MEGDNKNENKNENENENEEEDEDKDESFIGRWVVHELPRLDVALQLNMARNCFKLQESENIEYFTRGDLYRQYDVHEEVSDNLFACAEETHEITSKEDLERWRKTFAEADLDEEFEDIQHVLRLYRTKHKVFIFFHPARKEDYFSDYAEAANEDEDEGEGDDDEED